MWRRLLRRLRSEEGFGLLELMMSMVLLSTAVAALLGIFLGSAFSLARAGDKGTATVIVDRIFEYYHRSPWWDVRLVKHGPSGSGGVDDSNVATDAQYSSSAQCSSCPSGSSSVNVDEDAGANDSYGSGSQNNTATCNAGETSSDPAVDSTAPLTNCLAITSLTGADGFPYRVYTYMKYGCITRKWTSTTTYGLNDAIVYNGVYYKSVGNGNKGHTPSSGSAFWTVQASCVVDYTSKIITIAVRKLKSDGTTLVNTTATGILSEETETLSFGSYTSVP
jgi:hypothetical protein